MNELFAGYASYTSVETVLAEVSSAGNSEDAPNSFTFSLTISPTSVSYSWTFTV